MVGWIRVWRKNGWNVNHLKAREKINVFSVVLQTPVTKLDCTILEWVYILNFSHVSRYAINLLSVLFACSQALQDIGSFYRVGSKEKNFIQENKFSSQDSVKQEWT